MFTNTDTDSIPDPKIKSFNWEGGILLIHQEIP